MVKTSLVTALLVSLPLSAFGQLVSVAVRAGATATSYPAEGVVEAIHQTVISAQVPGAITQLNVKSGDRVAAGQVLAKIDARAAEQNVAAGNSQVAAAQAMLDEANKEYARQKQMFDKGFISQAALDRAESQLKASRAQANTQMAQAGASRTQSSFYAINAPFPGLVSEVSVAVGDMAMPGRPFLTLYDPNNLRVTINVAQTRVNQLSNPAAIKIEIPSLPDAQRWQVPTKITVLPMADAATHTVAIRLDLKPSQPGISPGLFARAYLPAVATNSNLRLYVPIKSVLRRSELNSVYVLNAQGKPMLRQVKLGPVLGSEVEVLSGLSAGEKVALDPIAAASAR